MKTRVLRLLAPLLLLLFVACSFLAAAGDARTTSPEERAQALSVVQAADDSLLLASAWMKPEDVAKGKATLQAMRDAIGATEFVPLSLAGMLSTAMRLAVVWAVPPPRAEPPPAAAPPG